jgi:hypothetical protein
MTHKPVSAAKDLRHKDTPPEGFSHLYGQHVRDTETANAAIGDYALMDAIDKEWRLMYGKKAYTEPIDNDELSGKDYCVCVDDECGWRGVRNECYALGEIEPLCPECKNTVEQFPF